MYNIISNKVTILFFSIILIITSNLFKNYAQELKSSAIAYGDCPKKSDSKLSKAKLELKNILDEENKIKIKMSYGSSKISNPNNFK